MKQKSYAGDGNYPNSYYAASRNMLRTSVRLQGRVETDICVVGAGYSGMATAIHLAEKGYKVVVVEGAQVGWGASGRNGGQVINGLGASLATIQRRYGEGAARFIGGLVQEGGKIIRRLVSQYHIECDLKPGNIYAACTPAHMKELESKQSLWRKYGMDNHQLLDREALRKLVNSDAYCGGMLDTSGGHMHPLNLVLGEARAFEGLGRTIYEMSPVIRIRNTGARPIVQTTEGEVSARVVVLCGNAYLGDTVPELVSRVMPVSTQMITTVPLGEEVARSLIPSDMCVEDARYILDYFRLSADKRMIFGGGSVYGGTDPADVVAKLRPNLEKVFPQLKGIAIDYAWSGNFALSFTRVAQMGRIGANTYFTHGCSGHGVTGSHLFGRILAEAIDGDTTRFDFFEKLPCIHSQGVECSGRHIRRWGHGGTCLGMRSDGSGSSPGIVVSSRPICHPFGDFRYAKQQPAAVVQSSRDRDLRAARPAGVLPIGRAVYPRAGRAFATRLDDL